ncbi:PAS domain-containing sensor histidine kinase [Desulfoferula mesophila]|uniref:histidine kinase n=1 Tax=Desulfoferula mesophila TaxID=3058419 RepID=A0AAU9E8N8_9BACT|nr:hypothetical protein FAK_03410 [Desulfoferula mesophilus]
MTDQTKPTNLDPNALLVIMGETDKLAHTGGWEWDISKDTWTFSANWLRLHGCSQPQLATADLIMIAHPDDRGDIQKAFDRTIAEKVDYNIKHRIIRQDDGAERIILASGKLILDDQGNPAKMFGAAQDITEQDKINREIVIREKNYQSLADNVPGVVVKYKRNKDGMDEIIYISKGVEDIFEVSQDDASGNLDLLWGRVHEDDLIKCVEAVKASAENLSIVEQEARLKLPGGRTKWLYARGVPLLQEDGSVVWDGIGLDITEKKQKELELRQSLTFNKAIIDSSLDCINTLDLNGNLLFMSRGGQLLLEIDDIEQYLNKSWTAFWKGQDQPKAQQAIQSAKAGRVGSFEGYFPTCKGTPKWWSVIISPILDDEGGVRELLSVSRDITERINAEKGLRQRSQLLERVTEKMFDMVTLADLNGTYTFAGKSHERIMGYKASDLLGNHITRLVHPDDLPGVEAELKSLLEAGGSRTAQYRYRHKSGHYLWLESIGELLLDDDNNPFEMIFSTRDITEHKKAEALLKENEKRYKSAQRMGNVGNWEYDIANETFWGSDQAKRIYGFDLDNGRFTVDEVENCIPERNKVHQALIDLIDSDVPYDLEFDIQPLSTTEIRTIRSIAEVERDDSGSPVKVSGVIQDITQQKQSLKQKMRLERMLVQAQKAQALGTLAGGIAHEFNNILAVIMGYADLVRDDATDGKINLPDIDRILEATDRAKEIVQRILYFSHQANYNFKPLNVNRPLMAAVDLLKTTLPDNTHIHLELSEKITPVMSDALQIEQVVMNLGTNARDAMPDGGTITIATGRQHVSGLMCQACGKPFSGDYVVISVTDTGEGMAEETLDRVFEPFFTTKEVGKGSGLGLAVVFGIVRSHDGHLTCTSEPGKGTKISIYFLPAEGMVEFAEKDGRE